MAAMLNSFIGSLEKVPQYINECKKIGVQILKPDINESRTLFTVKNNAIRFGLAAVKNVGEAVINVICEERDANGSFKDFMDFCKRTNGKGINKKCIESLIKCGAFESMNNRATLLASFEKIIDGISQTQRNNIEGQFNLFEIHKEEIKQEEIKFINEFPQKELLAMEKEMIGMYISGHPLDKYAEIVSKEATLTSLDLVENDDENHESKLKDDMEVVIGGIISTRRNKITKNNDTMAFLEVEDFYGKIDVIVFPKVLGIYNSVIKEEAPVFIKGRIKLKEDEPPTVICQNVKEIKLVRKLYLKIENELDEKVTELLKKAKGENPVYVYYSQEKVTKIAPKELWSKLDDVTIEELKKVLGEDNVKIVE
jgi:DNA polymerase-3 subunit alpha